jgi:CspA family cold shock protein
MSTISRSPRRSALTQVNLSQPDECRPLKHTGFRDGSALISAVAPYMQRRLASLARRTAFRRRRIFVRFVECRPFPPDPTRAMSYFDQPRRASQRRNQGSQDFRFSRPNRPDGQHGANATTEAVLRGRVKWFNAEKGFGFVALEDGTDVFLHGSVLARAGLSVNPGDTVRAGIGQGLKGRQVTEVLEVQDAAILPERPTSPVSGRARRELEPGFGDAATGDVRGVVKWWNEQKGFGFVTPGVGGKDVFVHASTAARAGLSLEQGMPVKVKVRQGVKGPEAIEIASA